MQLRWLAGDDLRNDERGKKHGCCGKERRTGYVDDGACADGLREDVGEDARTDESGDASEAVDGAL